MKRVYIEEIFDYCGYKCVCAFNANGYRCGYVAVDNSHPYFQKEYNEDGPNEIMCHFGLTYSGYRGHFYTNDDLWWFGFNCGHILDRTDFDTAREYGLVNDVEYQIGKEMQEVLNKCEGATVKDVEFVKENCKMIVEQLIAAEKKGD